MQMNAFRSGHFYEGFDFEAVEQRLDQKGYLAGIENIRAFTGIEIEDDHRWSLDIRCFGEKRVKLQIR